MKGFKSTSTNPYTYTQDGVWKKGQYTFQAVVLSDSGYAFAFQRADTTWQTIDLSWQVKDGSYSKIQWTFTLEADAVAFRLIANTVTGETTVLQPMLEKGTNGSTPIAHEEDLRGMDGDNHEFIFTRNTTGIAPDTPLSTQDDDYVPEYWTDNAQGVTSEIPFEFVSMREKKNGVWLDFSPPSLWAKFGEDGLSVNLLVEGHYNSHWEGSTKVTEIIGGVDVGGNEVVKVSAVFRKGENNVAATAAQSRGFQWYVNGVHLTSFDNQPFITLDETYGDGFTDYVVLSYLVNSIREEERREIINISQGMDGKSVEFIFKLSPGELVVPTVPQTSDPNFQDDDYHGQGTANEWEDDPVSPNWLKPIAWVSERKKVSGVWGEFSQPSIWSRYVQDGEDGKDAVAPIIIDGFWAFWDDALQDYVKSSFSAVGDDGHSPYVDGGYWYQWNTSTGQYENTNIEAKGEKGDPGDDARSILITATSTQIHVDKNGSTPASITVTASSDTVTPDSWEFSVDGASFSTNVPSCVTMTSYTLISINTALADFKTLSIRSSNITTGISSVITINRAGGAPYVDSTTRTWWEWDDATGAFIDTGMSPVGLDGAIPYPAGYYDNAKWYRREEEYAPYVQYGEVLYLLIKDTPNAGIPTSNTTYWKAFNQWEAVFVTSLVAKFAKIGGAVFTGDTSQTASAIKGRMISEMGVDGSTNYESYTGDGGAWQPKLMLDFLTGKVKFEDAEIKGKVATTSGTFNNVDIQTGTIGGLSIEGNSLINEGFGNDAYIIFRNDPNGQFVGIGDVEPASSGGAKTMGRFEIARTSTSRNTALKVAASGSSSENIALAILAGSVSGLALKVRSIISSTTLNYEDTYVSCYNNSAVNLTLPSSPSMGKIVFMRKNNSYEITVYGNGKNIAYGNGNTSSSLTLSDVGRSELAMFVFDGSYWMYNKIAGGG